ncbi:MAG: multiheme c-type cytochrome [Planctomycetota bacterium]
MTLRPRLAVLAPLALCLGAVVATLAQCGNEPAAAATTQEPRAAATPPADRIRLLISGAMLGRLEPCGCASGQLGGLARRMQHVGEQTGYDLLLEGGDLVDGDSALDALKLLTAAQALFAMQRRYDALGVGSRDLRLPAADYRAFLAGAPVVASDLVTDATDWPAQPFVAKSVRGVDVRVASLLLDRRESAGAGVTHLPPAEGWRRALDGATPATRRILMAHGDDAAIRQLIPQLDPPPDLVIGIDSAYAEPTAAQSRVGDVPLLFTGSRGRVLLDCWLHRGPAGGQVACELVPLPASRTVPGGGGDPQVKDLILAHRHDVQSQGLLAQLAERRPTASGASYVGTSTCAACHPTAMADWEKSKHAHAWHTRVDAEKDPKRYGWPVTAYPDCVGCHVVGYGERSGFRSPADTPHLTDVGCERCHGPGSEHVAAGGQKPLGLLGGVQGSQLCTQCHDYEQSPTFVYGDKWAAIRHGREAHQQPKK